MRKWPRLLLAATEAFLVLVAVYYEPSFGVRARLWNEEYFDGKPTSWWRAELDRWEMIPNETSVVPWNFQRHETWSEQFRERWRPNWGDGPSTAIEAQERAVRRLRAQLIAYRRGPSIIRGHDDAEAVLRQLVEDPSPKVRRLARHGLKMKVE
jgi:hypothetical protein